MTFRLRKSASAAASRPSAPRIASLCSPSAGAGVRISPGVPERRGTTWCIGTRAHLGIGQLGHDLARLDVRVGDELVDVVDRRGGDLGLLENG